MTINIKHAGEKNIEEVSVAVDKYSFDLEVITLVNRDNYYVFISNRFLYDQLRSTSS